MALPRCDTHKPETDGLDHASYVLPLGYPATAATCEAPGCANPARLWLTRDERTAFGAGERVFPIPGGARLRVADDIFPN